MNVRGLLEHGLLAFEERHAHTTGVLARNSYGDSVAPNSPYAVCWCTLGVLLDGVDSPRFTSDLDAVDGAAHLLYRAAVGRGFISASRCNDAQGLNGAIAIYRRAMCILDIEGAPTHAQMYGATA